MLVSTPDCLPLGTDNSLSANVLRTCYAAYHRERAAYLENQAFSVNSDGRGAKSLIEKCVDQFLPTYDGKLAAVRASTLLLKNFESSLREPAASALVKRSVERRLNESKSFQQFTTFAVETGLDDVTSSPEFQAALPVVGAISEAHSRLLRQFPRVTLSALNIRETLSDAEFVLLQRDPNLGAVARGARSMQCHLMTLLPKAWLGALRDIKDLLNPQDAAETLASLEQDAAETLASLEKGCSTAEDDRATILNILGGKEFISKVVRCGAQIAMDDKNVSSIPNSSHSEQGLPSLTWKSEMFEKILDKCTDAVLIAMKPHLLDWFSEVDITAERAYSQESGVVECRNELRDSYLRLLPTWHRTFSVVLNELRGDFDIDSDLDDDRGVKRKNPFS